MRGRRGRRRPHLPGQDGEVQDHLRSPLSLAGNRTGSSYPHLAFMARPASVPLMEQRGITPFRLLTASSFLPPRDGGQSQRSLRHLLLPLQRPARPKALGGAACPRATSFERLGRAGGSLQSRPNTRPRCNSQGTRARARLRREGASAPQRTRTLPAGKAQGGSWFLATEQGWRELASTGSSLGAAAASGGAVCVKDGEGMVLSSRAPAPFPSLLLPLPCLWAEEMLPHKLTCGAERQGGGLWAGAHGLPMPGAR